MDDGRAAFRVALALCAAIFAASVALMAHEGSPRPDRSYDVGVRPAGDVR